MCVSLHEIWARSRAACTMHQTHSEWNYERMNNEKWMRKMLEIHFRTFFFVIEKRNEKEYVSVYLFKCTIHRQNDVDSKNNAFVVILNLEYSWASFFPKRSFFIFDQHWAQFRTPITPYTIAYHAANCKCSGNSSIRLHVIGAPSAFIHTPIGFILMNVQHQQ